jgi:hypothetical protein
MAKDRVTVIKGVEVYIDGELVMIGKDRLEELQAKGELLNAVGNISSIVLAKEGCTRW